MKSQRSKILLIEDDPSLRQLLATNLETLDYSVLQFASGREGINAARNESFHLLLLDLGLPDLDGQEVIKRLRHWTQLPIIVLSARNQEQDITQALDSGADDYLTKPFSNSEMVSRIKALLRRTESAATQQDLKIFQCGELKIELGKRRVLVGSHEIHLTPIEFRLLAELVSHAGFVVTRRQLLEKVWGPSHLEHDHYLRIYMGQLRHKIEADPTRPRYLITEAGIGYRLNDDDS